MVLALLYMESQKALGFHKKYLNLCSKSFKGLERHEVEQLMTKYSFLG